MLHRSDKETKSSFEDRLARARAVQKTAEGSGRQSGSRAMGVGMRMSVELVSAVVIGGLVGWGLDRWLGTSPWLLLIFFMVGTAAGMRNIMRAAAQLDREAAENETEEGPKS